MAGEHCRTGCRTQDHASWGECARAASIGTGAGETTKASPAYKKHENWWGELSAYRAAREQGIQPASTKMADIKAAVEMSKKADKPFDADKNTFKG